MLHWASESLLDFILNETQLLAMFRKTKIGERSMFEFVDNVTPDIKGKIYQVESIFDIWELVKCTTDSRSEANRAQEACCKLKTGEIFSTEAYFIRAT